MAYHSFVQMSKSQGLKDRIIGCATTCGRNDAEMWTTQNIWAILRGAADDDWAAAWEFAEASKTVNDNPDTGARTDVISDEMVLAAVTEVLNPPSQ